MAATESAQGDRGDQPQAILGDLLRPDPATTRVPESEWIGLVQSIAAGDERALHTLYERTRRLVFTLIMRIHHSRETAEELTVDVFHDVWRRACKYEAAGGSVIGWILNQARSRAIDRLRFEKRKKRVDPHAVDPNPAPAANGSDGVLDLMQRGLLLRSALTTLTTDERQAIETAYFSELTYAQAALQLQQPLGTVKTRIRSGLEKLRQELSAGIAAP